MGAWLTDTTVVGKTLRDAYQRGQEDARHEEGHGGYTGTIAEKHDVAEFTPPKGMGTKRFVKLVMEGMDHLIDPDEAEYVGADAVKAAEKFWKSLPDAARDTIRRAAALADDKWGPAVAVELHGADWTAAKKWHRVETQRGVKAWRVFGMASC